MNSPLVLTKETNQIQPWEVIASQKRKYGSDHQPSSEYEKHFAKKLLEAESD